MCRLCVDAFHFTDNQSAQAVDGFVADLRNDIATASQVGLNGIEVVDQRAGVLLVRQQKVIDRGLIRADMNRGNVPCTEEGLNSCCIGEGTTFHSVASGFELERKFFQA